MNELQFWKMGEALSRAAIKFGDAYQVGKWRAADSPGSIDAHELLLFADLFGRLEEGEFAAFGFRIEPNVSDGPVRIPEHSFEPRPQLEVVRSDKLHVSGHSYERIRILPDLQLIADSSHRPIAKNPTGRRSTYAKSKAVLDKLFEIESNFSKSAARLHPDFEKEFKRQFPPDQWEVASPSERTLRDHLKRYRQELEETDNG